MAALLLFAGAKSEQEGGGEGMANYHEDIINIELENGNIHRSFLHHSIGAGDNNANRFGVRIFRNGVPENINGSCFGLFIRADGETVTINNGTVNGNLAYVTLPQSCYAIEGQFCLTIKVSTEYDTTTLRIIDGTVSKTSTGVIVDPGTLVPSIEDLIEAIENAVESIPLDYSSLVLKQNFDELMDNAKTEHTHLSVELQNVSMFSAGHFMDANGDITEVPNHSVHVIDNAERINQIRFIQLNTANAPLFIVKDKSGNVVNTYTPSNNSLNNFEYSCMVFPGGLPTGSKIYINYFYQNNDHTKVVTEIDIYFEEVLKGKPHGKDLFSREKALELSGCYYGYTDGVQTVLNTYCAGEARVSAGDVFVTSKTCHIAYYDEYGAFISGDLNNTGWYKTFTAPVGTAGAIVSFKIAEIEVAECLIDEIHFTIPVNQMVLLDGEESTTYVDDEASVADVNAVMKLPQGYSENGTPTPIIMIFHGAGFYVSASNWGVSSGGAEGESAAFDNLTQYFVYCGYAVCDVNAYDNTVPNRTFGSQRTIIAYKKLIEYVKDHYNVEKAVNGFGFSMGGLVALNYINEFSDLKCLAIASPVVALYEQGYYGSATWKSAIANSYGFDVPSGFEFSSGTPTEEENEIWNENTSLTNGYDPFVRSKTNTANTHYPFMRIWHGDSDTAVSYLKSKEFSDEVRERLVDCTYRLVEGAGHEICYGGSGVCLREYVRFFNRFNNITGITPR